MRSLVAIGLLLCSCAALAHGLLLRADSDGTTVAGTAYYSNGEPAAGLWVELQLLDGPASPPATAHTDRDGRFAFPVVRGSKYRISVIGDEGHRVDSEIVADAAQRGRFVEHGASDDAESGWASPPAWVWLAGLLILSALPALYLKLRRQP